MNGFFVAGTDTDAGKTIVTAALVRQMRMQGIDAVPMKVIQTGGGFTHDGSPISPDFEVYCSASSFIWNGDEKKDMIPLSFCAPCSPHMASRMEGRTCDTGLVLAALKRLYAKHNLVIAEGTGGINVPLSGTITSLDLIKEMGLPIILVIRNVLGCINHALNTIQVLRLHKIPILGAVMTETSPSQDCDTFILEDNPEIIRMIGDLPILANLPFIKKAQPGTESFWSALDVYMSGIVEALLKTEAKTAID
ncbi:dethiobiotin synthase [uncultured Desulfobacter sp.]|uniref:dethiobiotin synthase n=1 Tax=uncultured Desulfobacter sp. TaxID=240139 RepID=UPI002AA5EE28|nr:dethiobiotin synthase [uncultured Desulfobacter sp.]